MIRIHLLFIAMLTAYGALAQNSEEKNIQAVIDQMFDGMRAGDSSMLSGIFTPEASLSSIFTNKEGEVVKRGGSIANFITAVGTPHDQVWDELIWSYDIKIDEPMASAWTEYTFYLGDQMSHCGVNVFEMIHLADGWKISGITDTRRKNNCKTREESEINELMDRWHRAAAVADEDVFFGSMTADGVYIGTDASERWTRDEMRVWSKKYFDGDAAWDFKPLSRNIQFSEDRSMAWFDELLDTWMGTCRSSGVITNTDDGWKIKHYHLSIAVPNERVDGYLELIGKSRN